MPSTTSRPRAAIYARLSKDVRVGSDREGENVEEQVRKARAYCKEKGFEVVQVFEENDLSAAKHRPVYEDLRDRLEGGSFDVVVLGSRPDRLYRKPVDLEGLAVIGDKFPLGIHSVESSHIDLTTADGRYIARLLAATQYRELEVTSERIRASKERSRREGLTTGTGNRPYGFEAEYLDEKTPTGRPRFRLTGRVDEKEAPVIRETVHRLLLGDSLLAVAEFWWTEGIRNSKGGRVDHSTIRRVVLNPRTAGLSARLVDRNESTYEVYGKGQWEAVIEPEVQERLRLVLDDPSRRRRGGRNPRTGPKEKWFLSGLLVCGECGTRLRPHYSYRHKDGERLRRPTYYCSKSFGGCNRLGISKEKVEDYVRSLFVEFAKQVPAELEAAVEDVLGDYRSERGRLLTELDRLAGIRSDITDDIGAGRFSYSDGLALLDANQKESDRLRVELDDLVQETVGSGSLSILSDLDDVADLDPDDCRPLARSLFERIVIWKNQTEGFPEPVETRTEVIWR